MQTNPQPPHTHKLDRTDSWRPNSLPRTITNNPSTRLSINCPLTLLLSNASNHLKAPTRLESNYPNRTLILISKITWLKVKSSTPKKVCNCSKKEWTAQEWVAKKGLPPIKTHKTSPHKIKLNKDPISQRKLPALLQTKTYKTMSHPKTKISTHNSHSHTSRKVIKRGLERR